MNQWPVNSPNYTNGFRKLSHRTFNLWIYLEKDPHYPHVKTLKQDAFYVHRLPKWQQIFLHKKGYHSTLKSLESERFIREIRTTCQSADA
jgi:hypothetical protein